jgi:hypothetical protein
MAGGSHVHPDLAVEPRHLDLQNVPTHNRGFGSCTATQAWQQVFAAASTGGAYNHGEHGAYGRLLAWRSLAALAHAPQDASPADIQTLAERCSWYTFAGASPWFEQVAWDIGLATVSPDRRHLAILAATDTDQTTDTTHNPTASVRRCQSV